MPGEQTKLELRNMISELEKGNKNISIEEMRRHAVDFVIGEYGEYMYPGIRELPLDQPIREKTNLREMGCDGGFDPIPPQQIEYDASLTPLERFVALLRAAIQFYAYSGPAELPVNVNPSTRWGFLHLDQTGAPNTKYFGLHQDMVKYLTDQVCLLLHIPEQTWMQRGEISHIKLLAGNPYVGEELLLEAFFGEEFPELVERINGSKEKDAFSKLADLSDQVDNAHLCEFPNDTILRHEEEFSRLIIGIGA